MKYQWKYKDGISTNYYYDENGKIAGEVTRINFSDDIWSAVYQGECLGQYIDNKTAKRAVENKVDASHLFDHIFDTEVETSYTGVGEVWASWSEDEQPYDGIAGGSSIPDVAKDININFFDDPTAYSTNNTRNNDSQLGENH